MLSRPAWLGRSRDVSAQLVTSPDGGALRGVGLNPVRLRKFLLVAAPQATNRAQIRAYGDTDAPHDYGCRGRPDGVKLAPRAAAKGNNRRMGDDG